MRVKLKNNCRQTTKNNKTKQNKTKQKDKKIKKQKHHLKERKKKN